ncbi:TPA: acetyltransferase [Elizabethkingia anophelis]|nr:acetyltransferase [Elizabethkingia anophelis]
MYLFGAKGHGKVVAEILEKNNIIINAFIDTDPNMNEIFGYKILQQVPEETINMIISIGDNLKRKKIVFENRMLNYGIAIHPFASISKRAKINDGTVIMSGVTINSEVLVGSHCIINTNASIDHECTIGDFVHISPNAAVAGNVEIGEGTHIGIGSCIIQGIKIGKWCTIGAGAVVIKDIPDGSTVVGNPGRILKINDVSQL